LCRRTKGTRHETSIDHVSESAIDPIRVCCTTRDATRPSNGRFGKSNGFSGHDAYRGHVMTNVVCNDPCPHILYGLLTLSMPRTCRNKTNSIKYRSQDRGSDNRLRSSWQSAASSRDEDAGLLPKPSCVTLLERLSLTTISVSWCDATAGHYGDQIWTTGIAHKRAICALTGAYLRRGDAVYRPRRSSTPPPANFDRMILASALPECGSVPATDTVARASTRLPRKHHITPIQQPDAPAARQNTEAIERLQRT
jgi:Domain of unknown function (DUF3331)